jgi:hypothetical protein
MSSFVEKENLRAVAAFEIPNQLFFLVGRRLGSTKLS